MSTIVDWLKFVGVCTAIFLIGRAVVDLVESVIEFVIDRFLGPRK